MRPYGQSKPVSSGTHSLGYPWKVDYHCHSKNHRKIESWWAEFSSNPRCRTTIKRDWRKDVGKELEDEGTDE